MQDGDGAYILEAGSYMKQLVIARNLVKIVDGKTANGQSIATLQLFQSFYGWIDFSSKRPQKVNNSTKILQKSLLGQWAPVVASFPHEQ